ADVDRAHRHILCVGVNLYTRLRDRSRADPLPKQNHSRALVDVPPVWFFKDEFDVLPNRGGRVVVFRVTLREGREIGAYRTLSIEAHPPNSFGGHHDTVEAA